MARSSHASSRAQAGGKSPGSWRILLLAGLVLALGAMVWQAAQRPLVTDEIEFAQTGPSVWQGPQPLACDGSERMVILHHPQGYHLALGAVMDLAGGGALSARLLGLLSLLLCLPFMAWLARMVHGPDPPGVGWWAGLLLFTSPLAVQGALLVDIDNTLLVPAFLAFTCLLYWRVCEPVRPAWFVPAAALGFALLLWIKLPTPFLATGGLFICGLIHAERRRLLDEAVLITLLGTALFALTWWAFCAGRGLDALAPLNHLVARLGRSGPGFPAGLAKNGLRLLLWMGPWLILASAATAWKLWKADTRHRPAGRLLIIISLLLLLGYLVIGGNAFGFPRYHAPLIPLLAVLAAGPMREVGRAWQYAFLLGLAGFVWWLLAVGDPFFHIYTANEAAAAGDQSLTHGLMQAARDLALWLVPGILFWLGRRRLRPASLASVLAASCGAALLIIQFLAPYNVNYLYGERGLQATVGRLRELPRADGLVVAPKDLAYQALDCRTYLFSDRTVSSGRLTGMLKQGKLEAVIYRRGLLSNAACAPRLNNPELRALLDQELQPERVGDFFIFSRKAADGETPGPARP